MKFSIKVSKYQHNQTLNICDLELLGKDIITKDHKIHISKVYYGERIVEEKEAESLLKNSSIINIVGKETIDLSIKLGIGSKNGVKLISGIPFLIVFNVK